MATNVCICANSLEVDGDGRLCVKVAPDVACGKNLLVPTAGGLEVLNATYTLQRTFTADTTAADIGSGNFGGVRPTNLYNTIEDNGSAAGLWTVEDDGSVTIHCAGIYSVTQITGVGGATSQVVGGRARVYAGTNAIATSEFHDFSNTVHLAPATDGPEFTASNIRHLLAGTVLLPDSRVYTVAASGGFLFNGEFTLTYLGASAIGTDSAGTTAT